MSMYILMVSFHVYRHTADIAASGDIVLARWGRKTRILSIQNAALISGM